MTTITLAYQVIDVDACRWTVTQQSDLSPFIPLRSSCGSFFVPCRWALWHTVDGCRWVTLIIPPTILSSLGYYFFVLFDVFSSDTQGTGNRSSSSLRTCFDLSLTCAYRRTSTVCTNKFLTPCIAFVNEETAYLFTHMSDHQSIYSSNSRRPIISCVCDTVYTSCLSS